MRTPQEVLRDAQALPLDAQMVVVDALLADLHPIDPAVDNAWKVEVDRRLEQLHLGEGSSVPYDSFAVDLKKTFKLP